MNLSNEEFIMEEKHLESTIKILRKQISELAQEMYDSEEKQLEFKKYVWNAKAELDPTEMKTLLSNNDLEISEMERKSKYYRKLYKVQNSPYFGKISIDDDESNKDIYIGLTALTEGLSIIIYDWRAPISSIFYDYESGNVSYEAPGGKINAYLYNKRQFTIVDGKIKRVFDNKLNIQDDLLQEVLASKTSEKMKNIVNTIQAEQNAIIRDVDNNNLIVQGIAGSGKTSVALHRIAFLLYKINNLTSDKVLIFAPNSVFSEYISNVLPELGEDNTKETTFHNFFSSYITEYKNVESFTSFVERYYKHKELNPELIRFKQSDKMIELLENFVKEYTDNMCFTDDIFVHDLYYSKKDLNYMLKERYSSIPLFRRLEEMSLKIVAQELKNNKGKVKSVNKWMRERLNQSIDIKVIYKSFFESDIFKNAFGECVPKYYLDLLDLKTLNYEDACLFVYMKCLLSGFPYDYIIEQTIIDEAQDYSKLEYILLKKILRKSKFTILGDINQTINPYYQYNSLNDLNEVFGNETKYLELSKTYRSSPEIIEHTNKILGLDYVSAIRRDNNIPVEFRTEVNIKEQLTNDINVLQANNQSIAIITKTNDEALRLYDILKTNFKNIKLIDSNSEKFFKGLVVIPSYMAKGLEFDATIVYTEKDNYYVMNERYLYYVACTRSQHHLIIYNQKRN